VSLRQLQISGFPCLFALVSSLILSFSQHAHAEKVSTEEWNISADKVVRYEQPSSIVAQGNVVLEKKEQLPVNPPKPSTKVSSWMELLEEDLEETIEITADEAAEVSEPKYQTTVTVKADWMVYDVDLQSIKVKGNVEISSEDDQLLANEGTLNLATETGKFTDATILQEEYSMHLEGASIEKTGFDTYRIVDGWIITCKVEEGETPPWSFSSSNVEIKQGGYAVLRHAKFNIKNIPIFYSPYLVVPIKNTRQSGFTFPEFSSSSNSGFGLNVPYFWNISDSADATFYPKYMQKRGFMPGVEFRYIESTTGKGSFNADYLSDELSPEDEPDLTHDNIDRYWLRGKMDHTFAGSWQSRLDIDIVSDQDYLTEFESGSTGFDHSQDLYLDAFGRGFQNQTETRRTNSFRTLRSWSGMSLTADLNAINEADTFASDTDTPLMKLPGIDFSGAIPVGESDLTFDWNADYANYWREDGVGGHRFDIRPSIATPIPLSPYLESRAEFAIRDTFYSVNTYGDAEWTEDDTLNRLLPEFETEVATTLERNFLSKESSTSGFSHQIRPYIRYNYINDDDQDDLPDFDSVDFVEDVNAISYGFDNFFNMFSTGPDDKENIRDYGYFKIQQAYDLRSEFSDEPFSDIDAKLLLYPSKKSTISYKTFYDVYDSNFNSHNFEARYTNSRGDNFNLEYSFNDEIDIEQINGIIRTQIIGPWFAGAEVEHSISLDDTIKANGSLTYKAPCWSVKFETQYTQLDTTYLLMFNLANIGTPLGISL